MKARTALIAIAVLLLVGVGVHAQHTTLPVVDLQTTLTAHAGTLRGFAYVQIGGELLLVPVYTLPGDARTFRQ